MAKKKFGQKWCDFSEWSEPIKSYIVLNDQAEVFSGLKGGYPVFSIDFEDAKPLERESQFRTLERMSAFRIFKEYI
jgi:hypothetical protein